MARDDDLVRRAKAGDQAAWRERYTAHAGRLVVWLHTLTGGDAAVSPEDLASEAWLTAADKIGGFEGSSADFAGYLFGIARLLALNDRRRAGRRRTSAADPADLTALSPTTEPILEIEDMSWIRSRLAGLPPREREVVACLEVVGLDVATTATVLGLSTTAVRVARHRGLRKLRAGREPTPGTILPTV
jgi:RNA polymerase sigma-70 factor (ECF subfamily)